MISFQNALADTQLLLGEREGIDKRDLLRHAHARERVDVHAADRHRQRLAPQPAALTRGAGALAHALLQLRAHALALRLLIAAFEVVDDALKRLVEHALAARLVVVQLQLFALRAVEDHVHDLRREFFHRLAQREMIFLRQRVEVHPRDAVAAHIIPPRRADRAPSRMESVLFGMTSSGSTLSWLPRPVQAGHAPKGLLNENIRGVSSSMDTP